MARYIDADIVREKIKALYEHHIEMRNFSADGACSDCLSFLDDTPTADVVPRAQYEEVKNALDTACKTLGNAFEETKEAEEEADRLRSILDDYALQYGTVKSQQEVVDRIKADTAREIFARIDVLGTYNPTLYAELKKKYTEEGK